MPTTSIARRPSTPSCSAPNRLEKAAAPAVLYLRVDDVRRKVEELRADGVAIRAEPHLIFSHDTDTLGPVGTEEWHAFITDSEGNLVGLVSQDPPATSI